MGPCNGEKSEHKYGGWKTFKAGFPSRLLGAINRFSVYLLSYTRQEQLAAAAKCNKRNDASRRESYILDFIKTV